MKITFIYAFENEEWSTPLALAYEFQDKGWDVGIVSIGSNRTQQYSDDNIKEWLEQKDDSDIVLFMDWGRFDSPLLDKEKLPNAFGYKKVVMTHKILRITFLNQKGFI